MLSSSRWTVLDTFCVAVLVLLVMLRVLGSGAEARDPAEWYGAETLRAEAILPVVSSPMPPATEWLARHGPARLDAALRCMGLAEVRANAACTRLHSLDCQIASSELQRIEMALWPKGRAGQLAMSLRGRADLYARAYFALSANGTEPMRSSSQLIRDRDGAMCRQYLQFTEARLHGSKI